MVIEIKPEADCIMHFGEIMTEISHVSIIMKNRDVSSKIEQDASYVLIRKKYGFLSFFSL